MIGIQSGRPWVPLWIPIIGMQQALLLLCASASAAAFCSPAAGCGGMRVPRACAARVCPPALGSRLSGAARRERTGCVRASADGGDVEPPVLAGVQLAPGLGYEARKLTAWMPNLIKDRGVELMRVPRQNLLVEPITRQDGGEELLCTGPAGSVSSILTPTHVMLAQQLLQNKETLPGAEELFSRCDHAPLHRWSEAELAELQCAALAEQALAERAWLQHQHSSALGCSARPLETFLAAVDAVRTHALPCGGSLVVSPAACLLPRSVPRGATAALDDAGSGDLVIKSDGSGGLNVSAGWLTNDELLLSAGVAVLDLSTESVALPEEALWAAADEASALAPPVCDLSPSEWEGPVTLAAREKRQEVVRGLRRFSYVKEEEPLAVLAGGLCSDALGNIMQALCLSEQELALFGEQGCAVNIGEAVPISRQHETRVGMALANACAKLLETFPTSIEQDEKMLQSCSPEQDRLRQALHSRLSRKRSIKKCQERCEIFVALPTATATLRRPWKVNIRTSG